MNIFRRVAAHRPPQIGALLSPEQKERLYRYTSGRWLYNEQQQCAARYVEFDVDGAADMACKAMGAARCTQFRKVIEGSYNKVFSLQFDNDKEAILRIPCPVAGPSHRSTASEVATMTFAREELGIPVPKVLSWSSRADSPENQVGTEYILMERIKAVGAITRWDNITESTAWPLMTGLYDLEGKLARVRFTSIGSLYFKEDLDTSQKSQRLFSSGSETEQVFPRAAERYRIGPIANSNWYRSRRSEMNLDFGPWDNMGAFLMASAKNERAWIGQFAADSDLRRHPLQPSNPDLHLRALAMYESIVPYIVPPSPFAEPTLWHPDINLSNILIPESGPTEISALIDWQGAFVGPYCTQILFPPAFAYEGGLIELPSGFNPPELPLDFKSRSPEEQETLNFHLRLALRHQLYVYLMYGDTLRVAALAMPHWGSLAALPYWAVRSWSDGWHQVMLHLLKVRDLWDTIAPPQESCPIDLSQEEHIEIAALIERYQKYEAAVEALKGALGARGDGWVPEQHYTKAKELCEQARLMWDEETMGGPFPFQDGMYSFFLS